MSHSTQRTIRAAALLASLLFLSTPLALSADTTQGTSYVPLPHVYISAVTLDKSSYKEGDTVNGTFQIQNFSDNATPDITYIISLVGLGQGGHVTRIVYGQKKIGPYHVAGKATDTGSFTYDLTGAPNDPTLGINVRAILADGTSLAWAVAPLKMTSGLTVATPVDGTVEYKGTQYTLQEGPTVDPNSQVYFNGSYKVDSGSIDVTPLVTLQDTGGNPIAGFTMPPQPLLHITTATSSVRIALPTTLKSATYVAKISLVDSKGATRAPDLFARYIIGGDTMSVQYAYSNTPFPISQNTQFTLSVGYTGRPVNINDLSNKQMQTPAPVTATLSVKLYNESNVLVAESSSQQTFTTKGTIALPLSLSADAQSLTADIQVTEGSTVIASYKGSVTYFQTATLTSATKNMTQPVNALIIALVALAILALGAFMWRHSKKTGIAALIVVGLVSVGVAHQALANQLVVTENDGWEGPNPVFENISGGPPDTVSPGQQFDANITFQMGTCGNSGAEIIGDTNLNGAQSQHIVQAASGNLYSNFVMSLDSPTHNVYYSDYQDVWLGTFTAPSSAGTFPVNTRIQDQWLLIGGNGSNQDQALAGYWNVTVPNCSNGLDIGQYPSCTCPSGQVQSASACIVPTPTCSVSISPKTTTPTDGATVSWTSQYVNSISITNIGSEPASGSTHVQPTTSTNYAGTGVDIFGHSLQCSGGGTLTVDVPPKGAQESATCDATVGWSCDGDSYGQPVKMDIYVNGPWNGNPKNRGTLLSSVSADQNRPDIATQCGGNAAHGFNIPIPVTLHDGVAHTIYTYAEDVQLGDKTLLTNSSKTITCAPPCPVGQTLQGGVCVAIPQCTGGTIVNNVCQCPTGQTLQAGTCATAGPSQPQVTAVAACVSGTPFTISMTATDNSSQIRYGIDWNNDGTLDQFVPSTGFVASGVAQTASRIYSTAGAVTIGVIAYDQNGLASQRATYSGTCAANTATGNLNGDGSNGNTNTGNGGSGGTGGTPPPSPSISLRVDPAVVASGATTQVIWTSQNTSTCSVSGDSGDRWSGVNSSTSGKTSSPITGQTTYTLSCTGLDGSTIQQTATVNIIPTFNEI